MRHHLSASGIARARSCLFWARPDVEHPEQTPSREATFGTVTHAAIAATIETGKRVEPDVDAVDDLDAERLARTFDRWAEWWATARGAGEWQSEVAVAWNVRTGEARRLPKREHRDYGDLHDDEVPGTIDAVNYADGAIGIIDWKTGRQTVESPSTNPQLAHNAAALLAIHNADEVRATYVKITEDAVFLPGDATVDQIGAAMLRAELVRMLDAIPTSEPKPGPHCTWCPARSVCPATEGHVAEVVSAASLVKRHPVSLEIQSNDHAAWMLTAVDGVESFMSELKKRLREYADKHGGILLPDGTVWSRSDVTTERPDLSVNGALQALYALGLTEAIESKVTWSAIKRAGGKDGEKAARARLKELGAIKASTAPRYEAREVKGKRVA